MRSTDPKLFSKDSYEVVDETSGPDAPDLETILLPLDFSSIGDPAVSPQSIVTLLAILLR